MLNNALVLSIDHQDLLQAYVLVSQIQPQEICKHINFKGKILTLVRSYWCIMIEKHIKKFQGQVRIVCLIDNSL